MGSLRRRYPAQELRVQNASQTNGHANGYANGHAESEDEEFPSTPPTRQPTGRSNSHKRRSYPLQHLSTDRLRQRAEKEPLLETDEQDGDVQPSHAPQQTPQPQEGHASMRRRYPAQRLSAHDAPQGNAVQSIHGAPYANGAQSASGAANTDWGRRNMPEASQRQQPVQSPSRANSGRRRPGAYPAQALPVDKLPRIEPSRENLQDDWSLQQTPSPSQHSSERTILEANRRRAYPTQTLPIDRAPMPKPSREMLAAELKAQHIPPAIHAVKDADTAKNRAGRTLVVCLDGTGDKFDNDNSNIVHFVECLKKDDPNQVTYYQPGIGTYNEGQKLSAGFSAALDMAVGSGLGVHVRDAYRFLMATYREGDRICLFGFSRGAYTARCLAGMIHKVGLLPAHNGAQVPFAYEMYKDESAGGWDMSNDFKKTFANDVRVYYIGVFDSVASVGVIPRKLPLSANPSCVPGYFRHAMALDEHRAKFKCCRYQKYAQQAVEQGRLQVTHNDPETDVLEVWFAGCHADVGGGAVNNKERHMLSRIPLRWMIRQTFECETGILFSSAALAEKGLDVQTLFPQYKRLRRPTVEPPPSLISQYEEGSLQPLTRRSTAIETRNASLSSNPFTDDKALHTQMPDMTSELHEDHFDALARINDQLIDAYWSWALLELWPIKVKLPDPHTGVWSKKIRPNLGRYRGVQEREPLLHWTVKQRMESKGYKLKVRTGKECGWRVVV